MGEDYYEMLEVDRTATDHDLSRAYLKLVLIWHPHKNPTYSQQAQAKFMAISQAYSVLSDPVLRAAYDRGENPPPPPPPVPGRFLFLVFILYWPVALLIFIVKVIKANIIRIIICIVLVYILWASRIRVLGFF